MRALVIAAAALGALLLPACTPPSAGAATPLAWAANGWDIHELNQADPATAAAAFNTPASFGTSPNPAAPTVKDGFAATPVADFDSYATFAADIAAGTISPAFKWVMYDPEDWTHTPLDEQQDPGTYMQRFADLAHANGYKVIESPARDLGNTDTTCPKASGQTLDQWYITCGIAGDAAAGSDAVIIQSQVDTVSVRQYDWLVSNAQGQALHRNPAVLVLAEISTGYGTPDQMAAAANSVCVNGFYVSMSDTTIPGAAAAISATTGC